MSITGRMEQNIITHQREAPSIITLLAASVMPYLDKNICIRKDFILICILRILGLDKVGFLGGEEVLGSIIHDQTQIPLCGGVPNSIPCFHVLIRNIWSWTLAHNAPHFLFFATSIDWSVHLELQPHLGTIQRVLPMHTIGPRGRAGSP